MNSNSACWTPCRPSSAGSAWSGWSTRRRSTARWIFRNAGFKLAPVDTNLYPGGWNNLTPEMLPLAVQSAMAAIEKSARKPSNLLVIPENHTRNTFYLSNLAQLQRIFHMAGLNVRIGSIDAANQGAHHHGGSSQWRSDHAGAGHSHQRRRAGAGPERLRPLHHPAEQRPGRAGTPGILEDIHEQYLLPPLHAGWSVRRKSNHFQSYEEVSKRFGKLCWASTPG
jgi:glutamate--cysteine ligase